MRLATFNILNGRSPEDHKVDVDTPRGRLQVVTTHLSFLSARDRPAPPRDRCDVPRARPREQIDHLLADESVGPATGSVARLAVSDHCALVADLG